MAQDLKFTSQARKESHATDLWKASARSMVAEALKAGTLKRGPCEYRGCQNFTQAHHDDYNKPLDVRWLCDKHHHLHHHLKIINKPPEWSGLTKMIEAKRKESLK